MPLSWRLLGAPDLPAVTGLARACLSADGGQPFAAGEADITLNVNVNNARAAALYARLGFTLGTRRARYRLLGCRS